MRRIRNDDGAAGILGCRRHDDVLQASHFTDYSKVVDEPRYDETHEKQYREYDLPPRDSTYPDERRYPIGL